MSDNFVFRRLIDPLFAPHREMDAQGNNPNITNKFGQFFTRPDVMVPLLTSVSAIALDHALSVTPDTIAFAKDIILGASIMPLFAIASQKTSNFLTGITPANAYFANRTQKPSTPINPALEWKLRAGSGMENFMALATVATGGALIQVMPEPSVIAFSASAVYQSVSKVWRTHRVLSEEWNVHTQRPDKAPKAPPSIAVPTPA